MKKSISYILLLSSVFALASCNNTTSNGSASNSTSGALTPSTSTSPSVSPSTSVVPEIKLPTTIEEVKSDIEATKYKGFSFEDNSSKKSTGNVSFNQNEVLVKGKATFDEEGTSDILIYKGFNDKTYYNIENYIGKFARRRNIVQEVTDDNSQITLDDAKEELNDITYGKTWFQDKLLNIFIDGTTFVANKKSDDYQVVVTSSKTYTVNKATLIFDKDHQLVSGEVTSSTWPKDNFDETKHEPIDADQKPTSSSTYKATYELGEDNSTQITFDVDKYYITSIDEFYVSSFSDKATNDGKAKAGEYVDLSITKFSPATALNVDDFKIISSSNPDVIEISSFTGSVKAVKTGQSELTISDPIRSVTVTKIVNVESPSLTAIWLSITNKTINVNQSATITVQAYPTESSEELEAISSNPNVVEVGEISSDRTSLPIKGLQEGTSDITVRSKTNPSMTSRVLTITVTKEQEEQDTSWLIGTWNYKAGSFDTTFKFNSDSTGSVTQKVTGIAYDNEATFKWSYDGTTIKISSWYSEEGTLKQPTKITISNDKNTISLAMRSENEDGDFETVNAQLTKQN